MNSETISSMCKRFEQLKNIAGDQKVDDKIISDINNISSQFQKTDLILQRVRCKWKTPLNQPSQPSSIQTTNTPSLKII